MNVVDSCGWLEYIADGSNAPFFEVAILDESQLLVPSIVIFEVVKRLMILNEHKAAQSFVSVMQRCRVEHHAPSELARAAEMALKYKLAMDDAIIWQTATLYQAQLFTQDADLNGLPGVQYKAKAPPTSKAPTP